MVDLRDCTVLVHNVEEYRAIAKIAMKQGFKWCSGEELFTYDDQHFPNIIHFYPNKEVRNDSTVHEGRPASEIIDESQSEEKEMTAREFIEGMIKCVAGCGDKNCSSCILSTTNVHCSGNLCKAYEWKGNEEKLLEIVSNKLNEMIDEKAVEILQDYINNHIYETSTEKEAIELAIKKLRGE